MKKALGIALLCVLVGCQNIGPSSSQTLTAAWSQFQRFVDLEGEWRVVGGDHAQGATHTYRTVANGSVVIETAFPGQAHEMVTVVHLDGADLVLTHYCAAGNQPHMVAVPSEGDEVSFRFLRAGNLTSPEDAHMHDVSFSFSGADRFRSIWSYWEGGKQTAEMVSELERVRE